MDSFMALPANTNAPVRHLLLSKLLTEKLLSVYCPGDQVMLRQRFFPSAQFALTGWTFKVIRIVLPFARHA